MPFTQALARELAEEPWLAFACGRYEGIDERVYEYAAQDLGLEVSVVSLGDYVLNGGEVAVLAMVEAVARLLPGVIGNAESLVEESHEDGLLEYPVYTKPAAWESAPGHTREVPPVLLSGDHGAHRGLAAPAAARAHRRPPPRPAARLAGGRRCSRELRRSTSRAPPADAPELLTLQRACWVTEARANDTLDIPPLIETLEDVAAGICRSGPPGPCAAGGRLVGSVRGRVAPDDDSLLADRAAHGGPRPAGPRSRPRAARVRGGAGAAGHRGILAQHRSAQRPQPAHLPQGRLSRPTRRGQPSPGPST